MSTVPHLLYVRIIGDDAHERIDTEIVNALRYLPDIVTGVVLKVPCWQMAPNAARYQLVQRAIRILNWLRKDIYWVRDLWVSWPDQVVDAPLPQPKDHYRAAYYATAISRVQGESQSLGLTGCGLDCEPYGDSPQTSLKTSLSSQQMRNIRYAVEKATELFSGKCDIVLPGDHWRTDWFTWPLSLLGKEVITTATYYATSPKMLEEQNRVPEPPPGYDIRMTYWGFNVGVQESLNALKWVTPAKLAEVAWVEIMMLAYPSLKGGFIYVAHERFAEVMRRWRELTGGA